MRIRCYDQLGALAALGLSEHVPEAQAHFQAAVIPDSRIDWVNELNMESKTLIDLDISTLEKGLLP